MEKKNRYRNRVSGLALSRLILCGALLLATGAGFVLVRNQHVIIGNEIRAIEDRIVSLDREIEMWELRISGVRDRQELSRRLRWVQSDLGDIESSRLIELRQDGSGVSEEEIAEVVGAEGDSLVGIQ
jgi:hypothetical protein